MRSEHGGHRETEGARIALMTNARHPTAPEDAESKTTEPGAETHSGQTPRPPGLRRALAAGPWVAASVTLLLLGSLVLLLADSFNPAKTQGLVTPTPTLTPKATPTQTPIPTPTPMDGFQVFVDRTDGFLIQYPQGWVSSPTNPGVELTDDSNSPGFILQVLIPSTTTLNGAATNPNDPAALVDFELNNLSKQWPQGDFTRVPGPNSVTNFGGADWQGAVGLISAGQTNIKVQVYATVHNGTPYVINLLASNDLFRAGSGAYFMPMLSTFQFWPPSH